jgi:hypothetical protein
MNNLLKTLQNHFVVVVLGAIVLYWALSQYKGSSEGMNLIDPSKLSAQKRKQYYEQAAGRQTEDIGNVHPASGLENVQYASANGANTTIQGLPPSCTPQQTVDPLELLPKDVNSQWAQLNPTGAGDLKGVNLLSAGALIGIDTIGNTLRNANLQVRSEPPNPQLNVGPWNNTTIAPDLMRVPLEIGCGAQ